MSLNPKLSNQAANSAVDAVCDLLDAGTIKIYSGTQPASPDEPITSQELLATLTFSSPAFAPAVDGVASANEITPETNGTAGITSWFRASQSNGDPVFDGSVGATGANLNLGITTIQAGATVALAAFTYTQQQGNP